MATFQYLSHTAGLGMLPLSASPCQCSSLPSLTDELLMTANCIFLASILGGIGGCCLSWKVKQVNQPHPSFPEPTVNRREVKGGVAYPIGCLLTLHQLSISTFLNLLIAHRRAYWFRNQEATFEVNNFTVTLKARDVGTDNDRGNHLSWLMTTNNPAEVSFWPQAHVAYSRRCVRWLIRVTHCLLLEG